MEEKPGQDFAPAPEPEPAPIESQTPFAPFEPGGTPVAAANTPAFGGVPGLLARTAPWAHFLAIFGFCSVVLLIAIGIGAGAIGLATGRPETAVLMVFYPLSALLYFFPSLYLLQYAKRSRRFAQDGESLSELEAALDAQRRFWKFAGIATIVGLAFTALIFAGAVVFSLLARVAEV